MANKSSEIVRDISRIYTQHPSEPFFAQIVEYTQYFRDLSDLHYHNHPECGVCLSGNGVFFVEDRVYQFGPGTVTYFPEGMLHIATSPSEAPSTWHYLWFDVKKLDIRLPKREVVSEDGDLRVLCEMLYREVRKRRGADLPYYTTLVKAMARKMMLCAAGDGDETFSSRDIIMPAIKMISENFGEDLQIADLAAACSISEATFRRAFGSITGETPLSYLNRIRVTMAKSLLETTDTSILEIAICCGFPVLSTFNRRFLSATGVTPSQYRKNAREVLSREAAGRNA